MARQGILVSKGQALDSLSRVSTIIFDKTGTLTKGACVLKEIKLIDQSVSKDFVLTVAKSLESTTNHPLASAFMIQNSQILDVHVEQYKNYPGEGVEGVISGVRYRIGQPGFSLALCEKSLDKLCPSDEGQWVLLCRHDGPMAWFQIGDALRDDAQETMHQLKEKNLQLEILSGDPSSEVEKVAKILDIPFQLGVSIGDKLSHVRTLQQKGEVVMMVGDGMNDAPALGGAHVSIAMGAGNGLAKTSADIVNLSSSLKAIPKALMLAKKTKLIIAQNLAWAIVYNLSILPLACMGYVPPYLAAAGMSASSLIVVLNSVRLSSTFKEKKSGEL